MNLSGAMDLPKHHHDNNNYNSLWNKTSIVLNSTLNDDNIIGPFNEELSYRDPLYIVIPITIIYTLIFLTGIIGNISTCIVIARNKSMHTATNYYLFSLAVSDLLLLISGLPAEIYLVWSKFPYIFGEVFCVLRGLAAECSTNASVLTIAAFTVERYVAICHPFLSHTMSKLSRAIKLIIIIWLIGLAFAIPQAMQFGIIQMSPNDPDLIMCTMKRVLIQHSFELSTLIFFIAPMTLIIILYSLIGFKLRKSNLMKRNEMRSQRGGRGKDCRRETGKSSRRVIKMLVAVVIAFFICWAPFHLQRLIAIYGTSTDHISSKSRWFEILYYVLTYVSGVLYYVSATINPILYNIMSQKFRLAFQETLAASCCSSSSVPIDQKSYSSLSQSQQKPTRYFGTKHSRQQQSGPDSSSYSGNSMREDSSRQSTSIAPKTDNPMTIEANGISRLLPIQNPSTSYDELRQSHKNQISISNCDNETSSNWKKNTCKPLRIIDKRDRNKVAAKYANTTNVKGTTGKKWWRLFKWIPMPKVLRIDITNVNTGDGIADIECSREEYSMTARYIAKQNRFV